MWNLHEPTGPAILQLNVEGFTRSKCKVIQNIAIGNSTSVILPPSKRILKILKMLILRFRVLLTYIWNQSTNCKKVDVSLNDCLRLISGCIKSTPIELLPALCDIEPADIRRDKNVLDLRNRALLNNRMLYYAVANPLVNVRLKNKTPV